VRRRELQKEQTRLVLALAVFDLATEHGMAVRCLAGPGARLD
jgi:hypothetical protein